MLWYGIQRLPGTEASNLLPVPGGHPLPHPQQPDERRPTMAWPTTSNPRTEFVTLRLTADEAAELDTYASTLSMSRSEAVRDALTRVTRAQRRKAKRNSKSGNDDD